MIYCLQIGAFLQTIHSELPIRFCLLGKRRDEFEHPGDDLLTRTATLHHGSPPYTQEELMEAHVYRRAVSDGKYTLKALAWVESEEEGEQVKARFDPNEWDHDSMQLVPVSTIPNAR